MAHKDYVQAQDLSLGDVIKFAGEWLPITDIQRELVRTPEKINIITYTFKTYVKYVYVKKRAFQLVERKTD